MDSASEAEAGSNSERELNEVPPPSSHFQDVSHNPSMMVAYRDFIQGWDILLDMCPVCENFKRMEGVACSKTIIAWQRAAAGILPARNLPTVTFVQSIPLQGSFVPGFGLMAASHVLTIFRMGKCSRSTLAVSMVLVWKCPYRCEDPEAQ